jgi:CheY-like chemotaxis protein
LSLGATEILPKPVDRRQLISSIKRVMRGSEGSHILLVEDDLMTRGMLKEFLEREGWLVKTAENGRIAMQYIEQEQPALVLLDLMMPEMDGFEVVSRLRCDPQKESIPVVVLTAMDLDERDQMQLDGKVEKVLMKAAYDRNALLNEIRKSMSRRTQADDADPISRVS